MQKELTLVSISWVIGQILVFWRKTLHELLMKSSTRPSSILGEDEKSSSNQWAVAGILKIEWIYWT